MASIQLLRKDLRSLDYDDFLIMAIASQNISYKKISLLLNVTQPAISQRLKKIAGLCPNIFINDRPRSGLTEHGKKLFQQALAAVKSMEGAGFSVPTVADKTKKPSPKQRPINDNDCGYLGPNS